jgi:large conductance mechanosensitive channel
MWQEFRAFIARGNAFDLAVAVILGAAFGRIVTTLVEGVITPPLGLALGRVDFSSLFYVLDTTAAPASLADAKDRGVPVIAYGQLLNDIVGFLIVSFALFLVVRQVNRIKSAMDRPAVATSPATKECPFCASTVSIKATRCPQCTSAIA